MLKEKFALLPFQRDDLARLALHPGAILGWDTGLGKTIAMFLWPLLVLGFLRPNLRRGNRLIPARPVLLVVPGDGHDQTDDESRAHFQTVATRLPDQETFSQLSTLNPQLGIRELPPGYYLTSYTQLATNGVAQPPAGTPPVFLAGIGETKCYQPSTPNSQPFPIKCVYDPALIDLAQDCFGAIVVDEATKLQGEETLISVGCRQIRAPHRLPMTATPIKNRFPQLFRLAHFACGSFYQPTARFPYGEPDRDTFATEFEVTETNLDTKRRKRTAQVGNLLKAWKIFPAIILRRRKADCGTAIQPMVRHVIRTPMGIQQALTYKYHLHALYQDKRQRPALGARLQALRIAAANPTSRLLTAQPLPDSVFVPAESYRSRHSYIPKLATTLTLIEQILRRGEQVLVGGAFEDALNSLSDRLCEAGVPHLILDGRTNPTRRGQLARRFKEGCPRSQREGRTVGHSPFPVLLAGIESMAELHSFRFCNNVILNSYSWALDKMEQIINRAHRLNSPWPVNLWSVLCDGSADRVLEASIHEKRDAAELVLDARLFGTTATEVNLAELLHAAVADFAANQNYHDERDLESDWPKLRLALAEAYAQWPIAATPPPLDLQLPTELVRLPTPPPMPLIGEPGKSSQPSTLNELPLWQAVLKLPGF